MSEDKKVNNIIELRKMINLSLEMLSEDDLSTIRRNVKEAYNKAIEQEHLSFVPSIFNYGEGAKMDIQDIKLSLIRLKKELKHLEIRIIVSIGGFIGMALLILGSILKH